MSRVTNPISAGVVVAEHAAATLSDRTPLLASDPQFSLEGSLAESLAQHEKTSAGDRVQVRNGAAGDELSVKLVSPLLADVAAGDVVLASFRARVSDSMTGEGQVALAIGTSQSPKSHAFGRFAVGEAWETIHLPVRLAAELREGVITLASGYDRQTLEVADVTLDNLGPHASLDSLPRTVLTYAGREATASWRDAAQSRIEQLRKGDLTIRVLDHASNPRVNASVEVELKRHAFGFGTAVDAKLLAGASSDSKQYRRIIESLFNQAVFENDMKWPAVHNGVPRHVDASLRWLLERGIRVRGHNLIWPSWRWSPTGLSDLPPEQLRRVVNDHITRTAGYFAGKLIQWDVVNEPFSEHDIIDALGGPQVMVEWFKLARAADRQAKLFLNDYGIFDSGRGKNRHQDHFFDTLHQLIDSNAPVDGVGIQSHFSADLPSPEALHSVLDRFSAFGLPIESTELSINVDDESLQAEYLRDYLTLLFSHASVSGVTLWGFWSKRHWRPLAGLWDEAWRQKPAGKMLQTLLTQTWTTRATLLTNEQGEARIRGFCGDYSITSGEETRAVVLGNSGASVTLQTTDTRRSS